MLDPDETVEMFRKWFVIRICFVAAIGGFLFGYDWVVIGGAKAFYEAYFGITEAPLMQGWAMSSALVGCLVGAMLTIAAGRVGRKRLLLLAGVLFAVSAIGTAMSNGLTVFCLFRLLGGVGIGLTSILSPLYIAEVAPANYRGRLVSLNQLAIVVGILSAQVINLAIAGEVAERATPELIAQSWNGLIGWRWMFGMESIPAVAFFFLITRIPESPRWLLTVGKREQALVVLSEIGGDDYAHDEIESVLQSLHQADAQPKDQLGAEKPESKISRPMFLGIFLAVFQQWCGINVIFNYAQEIFASAGYSVDEAMFNIVATGVVNLLFTIVAIMVVDSFGRRRLLLLGAAGLATIYAILGTCYFVESQGVHMLFLVVSAIACYSMTLAPVTWVVISEIFPNRRRGLHMSVCVFALWSACTVLTFTFPILKQAFGAHGTFWLYGFVCFLSFFVIYLKMPETRRQTLEEIESSW